MAYEDYGDDDAFYFDDDDDYLYVEDDYAIADELAETQVPSPGYAGVNDEIANESFEYDVYEYFGELEYGSDSYWDARIKHLAGVRAGEKRKSPDEDGDEVRKRRKEAGLEARDNVIFVPFEERRVPLPPVVSGEGGFALLADWRERFRDVDGGVVGGDGRVMPADMKRAAEGEGEGEGEMEVDEHEDEYDEEDGLAAGVDQDMIMQVLRQKLADSGLGDVDESVFKDAIAKMLSGDVGGEDAMGELASLLLGQKDGGGKAFEEFLAGQGVDLSRAENEGDDVENAGNCEAGSHIPNPTPNPTPTAAIPKINSGPKPSSASTTRYHSQRTPTTRGKSESTCSSTTTTTATTTTNDTTSNPPSSTVVPSPPPVAFKTTRKRRAPSLDEPAIPQPEAPSAEPAAKRRRTPHAELPTNDPGPATGRRTTRSAAAAGKSGR